MRTFFQFLTSISPSFMRHFSFKCHSLHRESVSKSHIRCDPNTWN